MSFSSMFSSIGNLMSHLFRGEEKMKAALAVDVSCCPLSDREWVDSFIVKRLGAGNKNKHFIDFFKSSSVRQLIKGWCQSGKSGAILCAALMEIVVKKRNVLIVLRNSKGEQFQLEGGIKCFQEAWDTFHLEKGMTIFDVPAYNVSQINVDSKAADVITSLLRDKLPRVLVCIDNKTEIKKATTILSDAKAKGRDYTCIIDEADQLAVNSADDGRDGKKNKENTIDILNDLTAGAAKTYYITATEADILSDKRDIGPSNTATLHPPDTYRGFSNDSIRIVEVSRDNAVGATLRMWRHEEPVMRQDGACMMPFIGLISTPEMFKIKNMEAKANEIHVKYPGEFTTIVYNGKGCTLNYADMPNKVSHPCRNGLNASIYKDKPSDISIADVLHYLKVNNNGQYPKRIVIIAGGLAARGISFVSAYYHWHLRGMCYVEPKSASMPQMVQKVGRVCGTNKGGAPTITLYCPPGTARKLKEGPAAMKHMMEKVDEQFAATGESSGYANDIAKTAMNIKFKTTVKLTKKAALLKPSAWVEVDSEDESEDESKDNAKKRKREDGSRFKEGEIVKLKIESTKDMAPTTRLYVEATHTFLATCSGQWVKRSDVWKRIVKKEGMLKHSFEGRLSEVATQSDKVRHVENAGLYITKVGGEFKMMRVM